MRIQRAREARGIMQKDLAARIGRHFNTMCRWESGDEETTPSIVDAVAIARELQVPLSSLVGESVTAPIPAARSGPMFFVAPNSLRAVTDQATPIDALEVALASCVRIDPGDHNIPADEFRSIVLKIAERLRKQKQMTPAREALLRDVVGDG